MHSKAQWRYLYAIGAPFAHRWAEQVVAERGPKTGYRSLPRNKAGGSTAQTRAAKIRSALTGGS
jgi:hypothetical protein